MKSRIFVALNIPDEAKDTLFDVVYKLHPEKNLKWEKKDKIHLTLKFVGEIDDNFLPGIINDLEFLQEYKSQKLRITGFGFFFRFKEPKILWAGLKFTDELKSIAQRLDDYFTKFGIEKGNREFKPHLTLMRIKNNPGDNFINKFKNSKFEPIDFQSNSISLIKSELNPSGSVYTEIKKYNLRPLEE
ncbi:RNA 2',3'-cyclic phosphodiesterase [Ignavibacterium sp.]|jgi:2'-5' RNA ligase|uniref:RNA 2',3'-cyclic phosphodiesterase n=1 Tax=Ignavibacterium sp. TaxID=2651167 RepID=UPI0025C0BC50|nr:RNA 2',3'-cyclic phosphodiesterase [Ignavibacterium sp.]